MNCIFRMAVLSTLFGVMIVTAVEAQQPCVVVPAPAENFALTTPPAPLDPTCTVTFPVALWIVRTDGGVTSITDAAAREILNRLNSDFADHNIQFTEYGLDYIDKTDWLPDLSEDEFKLAAAQVRSSNSVLNIIFVNGAPYDGIAEVGGRVMAIIRDKITTSVATHEAGHMLSLNHTHGILSSHNERVRRNGTGVNCSSEADGFCDTPAEPWGNGNGLLSLVNGDCNYTGGSSYTDDMNDPYTPNTHNFMSYSQKVCRDAFTNEQVAA